MHRKRYSGQQAERLMMRLVSMSESESPKARKMLHDLLQGRFGALALDGAVMDKLRGASDGDVQRWVESVRGALRVWVSAPRAGIVIPLDLAMVHIPARGELVVQISTEVTQALLLQLACALELVGRERLQRCDCDRLFVRTGKRQFCSERCQKRVYMRRFRAGETGKE